MAKEEYDVIVVGAGNAAMCAAMSAHENGAKVVILERANEDEAGGNSRYTAGALRFAHNGMQDIMTLVELTDDEKENNDFGTYTTDQFYDDMFRVTQYRTDPDLCETLIMKSFETTQWMHSKGIRFMPMYGRQAFKVDGKMVFWGGLALEFWGGGPGIWEMESKIVSDLGIPIKFEHRAVSLLYDEQKVYGVKVKHKGKVSEMHAKSVILASGGFESNSEMRTRYLGPGWDLVKVRGTRHNMGEGIRMALDIGAMPYGNWAGCHAVGWDLNAPEFGDLAVGDNFQKHSYPLGIMVNATGKRFVDEGAEPTPNTARSSSRSRASSHGRCSTRK
jgi:tricarballylate dehydrogenase